MSTLLDSPEYQAAQRFLELSLERKELRQRLDEVTAQIKNLEPALVGYLSALGQPRFAIRDYVLSTARKPWIYPLTGVSREAVCEALKLSKLGHMVKENYSTESLTRYVKDMEEDRRVIAGLEPGSLDKLLPPALAHLLYVEPTYSIRVERKERAYHRSRNEEYEQETGDENNER
jgi:hypothetical protein